MVRGNIMQKYLTENGLFKTDDFIQNINEHEQE